MDLFWGSREMSNPLSPRIRVAVIEDQRDIREGLASLIRGCAGFSIAGTYQSVESALAALARDSADILLLDIGLPGMSGVEGIPFLLEKCPHALILVLTVYDDDDRIFRALCAGASGYLLKNTSPARLLECLREAADGGSPMSPEVARKVVTLFRKFTPPEQAAYDLTPHEQRVLRLLADGHSYRGAAMRLGLSVNTVSFHMKRVYEKLHVHSKSQAVAKALREGLVQ